MKAQLEVQQHIDSDTLSDIYSETLFGVFSDFLSDIHSEPHKSPERDTVRRMPQVSGPTLRKRDNQNEAKEEQMDAEEKKAEKAEDPDIKSRPPRLRGGKKKHVITLITLFW